MRNCLKHTRVSLYTVLKKAHQSLGRYIASFLILISGVSGYLLTHRAQLISLEGAVLGVSYQVTYLNKKRSLEDHQAAIEALLTELYQSVSPQSSDGELAQLNVHDCSAFYYSSPFFYELFEQSKALHRSSEGAFDPTVYPLVESWRAAQRAGERLSPRKVAKRRSCVGLDYIVANKTRVKKLKEGAQLDFGGLLEGYAAEKLIAMLEEHGIEAMKVVVGRAFIVRQRTEKPLCQDILVPMKIAAASSLPLPKVRCFLGEQGQVAAASQVCAVDPCNIIDPKTGYPANAPLVAAVVFAQDATTAQAYATAMLARGLTYAQELWERHSHLAVLWLRRTSKGGLVAQTSPNLQCYTTPEGEIALQFKAEEA